VQDQLQKERDLTARGEWDGPRPYLRFALAGREVVVFAAEHVPERSVEVE